MGERTKKKNGEKTIISPPTGISQSGRSIIIISQLHGIPEENIRIDLENKQLIISASKPDAMVIRKISVPECSRISKKRFRDGILEVILEKPL